jgi:hypothetical protein
VATSDQSSFESKNVEGACGSGTCERSHPIFANSLTRPSLTAVPRSASGCEVKNANGDVAAHSSPWKSMGVNGPHRVSSAAQASWSSSSRSVSRSPRARFPTWSWFWLQTTSRQAAMCSVSIGLPWVSPRNVENVPSWKNPFSQTFARAASGSKSA